MPLSTPIAAVRCEVLNVSPKTNWTFACVELADGRSAWGEASLNAWEPMLRAAIAMLGDNLRGVALSAASAALPVSPWSPGGLVQATAISAVQQALLELMADAQHQPWHAPLGPRQRNSVRAYANINRATIDRRPEGFASTARRAAKQGYTAFKAAPFDGITPANCTTASSRQRIQHGIDCVAAMRDAIGPSARLMVDCHWRFDETRALEVLAALSKLGLHWFECPLPETPAHHAAMQRVHTAALDRGVMLAAAETQIGTAGFQPLLDAGLYDVVMPDIKYCGGPWEMLRIAERAQAAGVQFSPHNPTGPIASLHSLNVATVAPACDMIELQFDETPLFDALLPGQHPTLKDGAFAMPQMPNLRLALNAEVLRQHPFQSVPHGVEALAAG